MCEITSEHTFTFCHLLAVPSNDDTLSPPVQLTNTPNNYSESHSSRNRDGRIRARDAHDINAQCSHVLIHDNLR